MKLKTKEWNWAEGAEQAKSKMKSIYWWNGWLALPALLRKRNGAQPKEPTAPRQANNKHKAIPSNAAWFWASVWLDLLFVGGGAWLVDWIGLLVMGGSSRTATSQERRRAAKPNNSIFSLLFIDLIHSSFSLCWKEKQSINQTKWKRLIDWICFFSLLSFICGLWGCSPLCRREIPLQSISQLLFVSFSLPLLWRMKEEWIIRLRVE